MSPPRILDDYQSALSINPWEEELRERRDKNPPVETRPHAPSTQKGLALIFTKVDQQVALLDKQLNNVRIELLQTRRLVTAVKATVNKLNQPEASKRLEEDVFSNYLRVGNKLKAVANNIAMIVPDHGRQVVLVKKANITNKSPNMKAPSTGRHRAHHDLEFDSGTRTDSSSIVYNNLTDSSDFEDWPRRAYRTRKEKALPPWRNPASYTERKRELRASTAFASRQTRQRDLYGGQKFNVSELRRNRVADQSQTPSDEPRIVERVPKSVQGLGIEKLLQESEEDSLFLESLRDVQERIQAILSGRAGKSPQEERDETESSNSTINGNWWNRLKPKFLDQGRCTKKEDQVDTGT
ncbi:hypothetical protein HFD88_004926 [Aspergillus terreus]|nr:hypothetical protein HFD88_004926 [Aspergillus terreus]